MVLNIILEAAEFPNCFELWHQSDSFNVSWNNMGKLFIAGNFNTFKSSNFKDLILQQRYRSLGWDCTMLS